MVSFWPWRGDDSTPASFEKTLSALSTKITTTQARLDGLRSASRRVRVLWTLYMSFAYLTYAIVILLVVGWQRMGPWEWSGVAGGPVLIYVTRTGLSAFYNFRIESLSAQLKDQQTERTKTIQKLKDATKYDSTLELLEKYGGPENKPTRKGKKGGGGEEDGDQARDKKGRHSLGTGGPGRTGMPPPPTANIARGDRGPIGSAPGTPQPVASHTQFGTPQQQQHQQQKRSPVDAMTPSADFAPNAFGPGSAPPAAQYVGGASEPRWYDRVLDLLLGEDETASKNRIVLICKQCRLVNGQAPPGTKSLAELGTWKCMACGTTNGEVDEGKRIVREVLAQAPKRSPESSRLTTTTTPPPDGISDSDTEDGSSELVEVEREDAPETNEAAEAAEIPKQKTAQDDGGDLRKRKGKGKGKDKR